MMFGEGATALLRYRTICWYAASRWTKHLARDDSSRYQNILIVVVLLMVLKKSSTTSVEKLSDLVKIWALKMILTCKNHQKVFKKFRIIPGLIGPCLSFLALSN